MPAIFRLSLVPLYRRRRRRRLSSFDALPSAERLIILVHRARVYRARRPLFSARFAD